MSFGNPQIKFSSGAGIAVTPGGPSPHLPGDYTNPAFSGVSAVLTPSGADDSAAMITALTSFAPFSSPSVMMEPGTFRWLSGVVPAFLRNTPARVRGQGVGRTIIQLDASTPRAFDFGKVADYDTFTNIDLADFTVDCNNVGGQHHVVLGTYRSGVQIPRLNINNITARRITTINVPSDSTTNNHRLNLWIAPVTNPGDNPTTLNNHVYEDLEFNGGNMGLVVAAVGTNATATYAHIVVNRLFHDTGLVGNLVGFASSNLQIGSAASGTDVSIDNVRGLHSGDVGVEVDNCADMTIGTIDITDVLNAALYLVNFYNLGTAQIPTQVTKVGMIRHTVVSSSTTTTTSISLSVGNTTTHPYGKIIVDAMHGMMLGTTHKPPSFTNQISCASLEIGAVHLEIPFAADTTTVGLGGGISITPTQDMFFRLGSHTSVLAGSYTAAQWTGHVVVNDSAAAHTLELDLNNIHVDFTNFTPSSVKGFVILSGAGRATNLKITGRLRGLRVKNSPTVTQGGLSHVFTTVAANIPPWFKVEDCDFSGMAGGSEIFMDNSSALDNSGLQLSNIVWRAGTPRAGVNLGAIGASPWAVTNKSGSDATFYLMGGTVTTVVLTNRGFTPTVATSSNCAIRLRPGDTATVTYTVVPTSAQLIPDV